MCQPRKWDASRVDLGKKKIPDPLLIRALGGGSNRSSGFKNHHVSSCTVRLSLDPPFLLLVFSRLLFGIRGVIIEVAESGVMVSLSTCVRGLLPWASVSTDSGGKLLSRALFKKGMGVRVLVRSVDGKRHRLILTLVGESLFCPIRASFLVQVCTVTRGQAAIPSALMGFADTLPLTMLFACTRRMVFAPLRIGCFRCFAVVIPS